MPFMPLMRAAYIQPLQENLYTKEEMKVTWETRKILDVPDMAVRSATVCTGCMIREPHCSRVCSPLLKASLRALNSDVLPTGIGSIKQEGGGGGCGGGSASV